MVAPKGNKHAVGHGRPPLYSDEELIVLGQELLDWMDLMDKENKEIVHLSEFYSEYKNIPRSDWWIIAERPCFSKYYEKARDWMGKRILKNERLPHAYGSRFLGMYLKDLRDHEKELSREKIDYEIEKRESITAANKQAPQDSSLSQLLSAIHSQPQIDKLLKEIEELKAKLNDSQSKAD